MNPIYDINDFPFYLFTGILLRNFSFFRTSNIIIFYISDVHSEVNFDNYNILERLAFRNVTVVNIYLGYFYFIYLKVIKDVDFNCIYEPYSRFKDYSIFYKVGVSVLVLVNSFRNVIDIK